MPSTPTLAPSLEEEVPPQVADFYRRSLRALRDAGIPFLVGGAFSLACYTGIRRVTKDLDLFILREDFERIAPLMQQHGWRTELTYPHWLAKVYDGDAFIDLIFNSGNGVTPVDKRWFHGNCRAEVLGVPVHVANVEDNLLSKAFIMERERYDGGDIAHLLLARAERLDWTSLLERFGAHWRVLLTHLTLFGYIYPGERHRIPAWVMARLVERLTEEMRGPPAPSQRHVCAGTLLSREQYLHDVEQAGYVDGRLTPASAMTARDVAVWRRDIEPGTARLRNPTDDREQPTQEVHMDDDTLWRTEEQFWSAGADFYEQHLAAQALMVFPAPAGVLDRAATLASIRSGNRWAQANFEKRQLLRPADDTAVLVYAVVASRDDGAPYRALCSSTYVKQGAAWRLALHHQTPQ